MKRKETAKRAIAALSGQLCAAMSPLLLYHERQTAALCGMHAVNCLLQGPCLGEWDLAEIGHSFDAAERAVMLEAGVESDDFVRFAAEDRCV